MKNDRSRLVLSVVFLVVAFVGSNIGLVSVNADAYMWGRIWDQCGSGATAWESGPWECPAGWVDVGVDSYTEACSESSQEYCAPLGYGGGCTRYFLKCEMIQGQEPWCEHNGNPCFSDYDCCSGNGKCKWNDTWQQHTCGGT